MMYYGSMEIILSLNGRRFCLFAEVADVRHSLLSVSRLEEHGHDVLFRRGESAMSRADWRVNIHRMRNLYHVRGEIVAMRRTAVKREVDVIMPLVEIPPDTGGASGSGHQPGDDSGPQNTTRTSEEPRTIREVPEPHMPDFAVQRMHTLL